VNFKQLQKHIGRSYRLRPLPIRRAPDGIHLGASDDQWKLRNVLENPSRIELSDTRTDRVIELQGDNLREYRSPDFLMLRCQLLIDPSRIAIEPLVGSAGFDDDSGRGITKRLLGDALRLLGYCVQTENAALNHYAEADAAMEVLGLSLARYKAAAEELAAGDLVTLSPSLNYPGILRTTLRPIAFLEAAPHFLRDEVDLSAEVNSVFVELREAPEDQSLIDVHQLHERTGIPLPRLDLILRALDVLGHIKGRQMASGDWTLFWDLQVTPEGRRMLRGEDAFPYC
jgi:hypothetical protein